MASKQDNYLRMHHPRLYKGMKKGGKVEDYKKGGKVACYAQGGYNTDTVPAMLTPGEVVLNAEQQEALGKLVGMKPAALFEKIGIPGFAGGGVADKKDALVQYYQNGGKADNLRMDRHTLMSMGIEDPSSKTTPGEVENKFADLSYTPYGKK